MDTPEKVDSLFVFEAGSINTIIKEHTGPIYNGPTAKTHIAENLSEEDEAIITELQGIFYGDKDKAREFLVSVKSMKDTEICAMVKNYVKNKIISEISSKKPLWEILNKHNIYTKTLRNWNDQV